MLRLMRLFSFFTKEGWTFLFDIRPYNHANSAYRAWECVVRGHLAGKIFWVGGEGKYQFGDYALERNNDAYGVLVEGRGRTFELASHSFFEKFAQCYPGVDFSDIDPIPNEKWFGKGKPHFSDTMNMLAIFVEEGWQITIGNAKGKYKVHAWLKENGYDKTGFFKYMAGYRITYTVHDTLYLKDMKTALEAFYREFSRAENIDLKVHSMVPGVNTAMAQINEYTFGKSPSCLIR